MSLGQSRIDIILDGISPFTYTVIRLFSQLYLSYPIWSPKTPKIKLCCWKGAFLASLIARKSTCAHTNSDKSSSLFLTELMLIYDRQTFFECFRQESFKLFFVFLILAFVLCVGPIEI